ncbi:MAG: hypothetical protein ACOC2M_02495, partial [bacterium]
YENLKSYWIAFVPQLEKIQSGQVDYKMLQNYCREFNALYQRNLTPVEFKNKCNKLTIINLN